MKTYTQRWTCRIVRAGRFLAGDQAANRGFGSSHLASCADCQRYFAALDSLTSTLRLDANIVRRAAPVGMDRRVLQAIASESRPRARERHAGRLAFALAGVTAAVVLALVPLRPGKSRTEVNLAVDPSVVGPQLNAALASLPTLNVSMAAVMQKEPLQQEVNSVYADARSAVRFLALNFLPDNAPSPTDQRTQTSGG